MLPSLDFDPTVCHLRAGLIHFTRGRTLAATLVVLATHFTTTNMALETAFWSGAFAVNDFGSAIAACATLQGGIVWKRDTVDFEMATRDLLCCGQER
jgi:hypothetical protein